MNEAILLPPFKKKKLDAAVTMPSCMYLSFVGSKRGAFTFFLLMEYS
jgi:hypothetical protein